MIKIVKSAVATVCLLLPFASVDQAQASQTFDCGDGVNIVTNPQDQTASFTIPGRSTFSLPVGFNGGYDSERQQLSFRHEGSIGILSLPGRNLACQVVSTGAPTSGDSVANRATDGQAVGTRGQSLGGVIRNGPGMEYKRLTSLPEGAYLTIVANTGQTMNDYDWFEIRLDNGDTAFMWGGILCSMAVPVPGIFAVCAND